MSARPLFALAFVIAAGCGPSVPNPGGPDRCGGGLLDFGCLCVGGTCTCSGTSRCDMTCGDDCVATCNNTAGCDTACGAGCNAICNGTEECTFAVGQASQVTCNGTGGCDIDCAGGDCTAVCNGTNGCEMLCPLGGCSMTCGVGAVTECDGGTLVCGRACP